MHLAIRADGGPDIGFGHLVRTGAIAEAFLDRGHVVTYCTRTTDAASSVCPDGASVRPLVKEGREDDEPPGLGMEWLKAVDPDLVLTDTYAADTEYQRRVTERVAHAVVMDDTRFTMCTDWVVNGNVNAPDLDYEWIEAEPTWCLGTDYLPIRSAIRTQRAAVPPPREPPELALVTMGGSDIRDATPAVIGAFGGLDLDVTVLVGPGFSNRQRIERAVETTDARFEVVENPPNLSELMAAADIAVSAAGSTVYELMALGTPTIAIPQAANQRPIAEALAERDAAERLHADRLAELPDRITALVTDHERRERYRERGMDLVDCAGPDRLYRVLVKEEFA